MMTAVRLAVALATLALLAGPALAAFPGENGRIAHTTEGEDPQIALANPDGAGRRAITATPGASFDPAFSPDGLKIAFASDRSGASLLYVMDFDGTDVVELPGEDGFAYGHPAWSPDGAKIAFERTDLDSGDTDVWAMNADGTDPAPLVEGEGFDGRPAWNFDATKLLFVSDRDGDLEIYAADADGQNPVRLTDDPGEDTDPDWAPDGLSIVFSSDREGGIPAIFSMGADGSDPVRLADGRDPVFSPDGALAAFVSGENSDLAIMNADGSDPVVFETDGVSEGAPSWQPIVAGENQPPVADAGPDVAAECTSPDGAIVTLDGSGSIDPDSTEEESDLVLFEWFEDYGTADESFLGEGETLDVGFALGSHAVTLQVTDSVGQTSRDDAVVVVEDTTPPEISVSLTPDTIWPPNHKMVPVHARVRATDVCGEVTVVLDSVVSSEPDNGLGDGDTENDIQGAEVGTADFSFMVRAERSGHGKGRTYTATYVATDESGNSATASGETKVLHDRRGGNGNGNGNGEPERRLKKAPKKAGERVRAPRQAR